MESKNHAERYFTMKVRQAQLSGSSLDYKLVFAIIEDFQTTRHILNEKESKAHQLESMILSALTGQQVKISEWPQVETRLLDEYV